MKLGFCKEIFVHFKYNMTIYLKVFLEDVCINDKNILEPHSNVHPTKIINKNLTHEGQHDAVFTGLIQAQPPH